MSAKKRAIVLLIMSFIFFIQFAQVPVSATEAPYSGYTYDAYGRSVPTPITYTPEETTYGEDLGIGVFKGGEDLFVYDNKLYILDTGNNRIVVLDSDMKLVSEISKFVDKYGKESPLNNPKGLFIKNDLLYIADTDNSRIITADFNGNILSDLKTPQSSLISPDAGFKPTKLVVDRANNIYVQCAGYYSGLVEYNKKGEFKGFYGGNRVQLTFSLLTIQFWKSIFNKEQRESLQRFVPVEYSNIFISGDFIYTATKTTETSRDEVQKLNPMGVNVLHTSTGQPINFGDLEVAIHRGIKYDNAFVDIHVDKEGIISVLDETKGRVFLYDQEVNLLGTFGASGSQKGAFKIPTAIEKINNNYVILDKEKRSLTVFKESEYMSYIRKGIKDYSSGLYKESIEQWRNVLRYNSGYTLAYKSIGRAMLQNKEYIEALRYLRLGHDQEGYSRALGVYRKEFVRQYFLLIVIGIVLFLYLFNKLIGFILKLLGVKNKKSKMIFT